MGVKAYQVMVDQWGHTPGFPRGTTVLINDDDPQNLLYSVNDEDPLPLVADVGHALRAGSLLEVDDRGNPLRPGFPQGDLPFPTGRLPVGNEAALDRGAPTDPDNVPIPSGSADPDDGELSFASNPHPEPPGEGMGEATNDRAEAQGAAEGQSEEDLTPAQKAARTRAANLARQGQVQ